MPPKFSSQRLVLNKSSSPVKKGQEGHPSAARKRQQQPAVVSNHSSDTEETGSDTHDTNETPSATNSSTNDDTDDLNVSRNTIDSGDDDWMHSSLDDDLSDKSKSTMSTDDTFIKQMKSSLPCGLTMVQLMISIILVPIIFLVVYTSLPLADSISAVNFLADQRPIADMIIDLAMTLEEERFFTIKSYYPQQNTSKVLDTFATVDSRYRTNFSKIMDQESLKKNLVDMRKHSEETVTKLLAFITDSDSKYQAEIQTSVKTISSEISKIRQRISDDITTRPKILQFYFDQIEEIFHLILRLLIDSRVSSVYDQIMMFTVKMRMVNSFSMIRDAALSLFLGAYDLSTKTEALKSVEFLQAMLTSVDRDKLLIENAGNAEERRDLNDFRDDGEYLLFRRIAEDLVKVDGNSTVIYDKTKSYSTYTTLDSFIVLSEKFIAARQSAFLQRLAEIKSADRLRTLALEEGMKMLGAVVACLITAAFVIYLNIQEQQRMDVTLSATKRLAKAVQRFVPKAQLKMMGVRSVVDVRPSLAVEVANSMLASDIRDFTKLSEEMENLELFSWLQQYVERMTAVVQEQKGIVSQIIGDALHCLFPQPVNAVNGAINMHVSADQLNLELVAQGVENLVHIGVGLHFGVVVVGVFGDSTRLSTSIVAADVNLANQLESLTKPYGTKIMCSDAVAAQINIDDYDIRSLGTVKIGTASTNKGEQQTSSSPTATANRNITAVTEVKIFDIFQTDPVKLKSFKRETLEDFELAVKSLDKNPGTAQKLFEKCLRVARQKGIRDFASEKLYGELMIRLMMMTGGGGGGGSGSPTTTNQTPGGFSSIQHVSSVTASDTGVVADETVSRSASRRASDAKNARRSSAQQQNHQQHQQSQQQQNVLPHQVPSAQENNNNNSHNDSSKNLSPGAHTNLGGLGLNNSNTSFVDHKPFQHITGSPIGSAAYHSAVGSNVSSNIARQTSSSVHGGAGGSMTNLSQNKSSSVSSAGAMHNTTNQQQSFTSGGVPQQQQQNNNNNYNVPSGMTDQNTTTGGTTSTRAIDGGAAVGNNYDQQQQQQPQQQQSQFPPSGGRPQLPPMSSPPSTAMMSTAASNNNNNNNNPHHSNNSRVHSFNNAPAGTFDTPHENAVTAQMSSVTMNSAMMNGNHAPGYRHSVASSKITASVLSEPIPPEASTNKDENLNPNSSNHNNNNNNNNNSPVINDEPEKFVPVDVIGSPLENHVREGGHPKIFTFDSGGDPRNQLPMLGAPEQQRQQGTTNTKNSDFKFGSPALTSNNNTDNSTIDSTIKDRVEGGAKRSTHPYIDVKPGSVPASGVLPDQTRYQRSVSDDNNNSADDYSSELRPPQSQKKQAVTENPIGANTTEDEEKDDTNVAEMPKLYKDTLNQQESASNQQQQEQQSNMTAQERLREYYQQQGLSNVPPSSNNHDHQQQQRQQFLQSPTSHLHQSGASRVSELLPDPKQTSNTSNGSGPHPPQFQEL